MVRWDIAEASAQVIAAAILTGALAFTTCRSHNGVPGFANGIGGCGTGLNLLPKVASVAIGDALFQRVKVGGSAAPFTQGAPDLSIAG